MEKYWEEISEYVKKKFLNSRTNGFPRKMTTLDFAPINLWTNICHFDLSFFVQTLQTMKVWFLHIFYSNIHSNSFTLRLQKSVNMAFQLLITLERKHLGLSVHCFGKWRCQIIKNLKFELHQEKLSWFHSLHWQKGSFFSSFGLQFLLEFRFFFLHIEILILKTFPSIFEWYY